MPAKKRSAPTDGVTTGRRRSHRLSDVTGQKSSYFESADESKDEQEEPVERPRKRGRPSKKPALKKEEVSVETEEEVEQPRKRGRPAKKPALKKEEISVETEEDVEQPRKRGRPAKKLVTKREVSLETSDYKTEDAEDELQEESKDDDSELDESAPMKVTVIPLEKMRDLDGVEYAEERLHKNTLLFLKDLKANNRRSWLKSHDGEYRRSLKDWNSFVDATTLSVIDVDETIPELPVKDVSFRIHRDIRFSKDPTPYKPHFSAAWSRTGRKGPYACYYIHCEPRKCIIAGGLWCPERDHLAKLRENIDRHPRRWREALNNEVFKQTFYPKLKAKAGDDAVLDALVESNKAYSLKNKPKGYEIDHRDIKLLRLKSFTVAKQVDDSLFTSDDAQEKIKEVLQGLNPFVEFLNNIVMPDRTLHDDSDDESEDNEDEPNLENGQTGEENGDADEESGVVDGDNEDAGEDTT